MKTTLVKQYKNFKRTKAGNMVKILIADEYAIVRKGVKQILLDHFKMGFIKELSNAENLVSTALASPWDAVICGINSGDKSILEQLQQIRKILPQLPVIIMGMHSLHPDEHYAIRALQSGASGFLSKDTSGENLVIAVENVMQGKKYFVSTASLKKVNYAVVKNKMVYEYLSEREFAVMKYLASGKTISDIAVQLSLSVTTISTYRSRIMGKTGFSSNSDLTRYALENHLL